MSEKHEQTEFEMGYRSLGKRPNYIAYQVIAREEGGKSNWTKIGVGFMHGDGGGVNVLLDCLPIDGRVTLRACPYSEDRM